MTPIFLRKEQNEISIRQVEDLSLPRTQGNKTEIKKSEKVLVDKWSKEDKTKNVKMILILECHPSQYISIDLSDWK